ncbi:hypothetical protein X975_26208, partial [Stegodyphus mimosarum]
GRVQETELKCHPTTDLLYAHKAVKVVAPAQAATQVLAVAVACLSIQCLKTVLKHSMTGPRTFITKIPHPLRFL